MDYEIVNVILIDIFLHLDIVMKVFYMEYGSLMSHKIKTCYVTVFLSLTSNDLFLVGVCH